jgi:hypothetical protein
MQALIKSRSPRSDVGDFDCCKVHLAIEMKTKSGLESIMHVAIALLISPHGKTAVCARILLIVHLLFPNLQIVYHWRCDEYSNAIEPKPSTCPMLPP